MRKRQVAILIRNARPVEAAQIILESGIDRTVGLELLTDRVIAHFRTRLRGEDLGHASREWHTAVTNGVFQWERAISINGLLGSIERSARRREREHRDRHISRHTVAAEPVTHVSWLTPLSEENEIHRHLAVFATADGKESGFRPALAKRQALIDCVFPAGFVPTRIKDTQAAKAIKLAKQINVPALAFDILDGEGDQALAAEVWPYLAGQPGEMQRAVLEVFASWDPEMATAANGWMCYRDTDRSGPNRGKPQPHIICPAAEAPELEPLLLAS